MNNCRQRASYNWPAKKRGESLLSTHVETVEFKQSDWSFTQWRENKKTTDKLYFAQIYLLYPDIQTRLGRFNKGSNTGASYKFTFDVFGDIKMRERKKKLTKKQTIFRSLLTIKWMGFWAR
jgi:hypothetical protein